MGRRGLRFIRVALVTSAVVTVSGFLWVVGCSGGRSPEEALGLRQEGGAVFFLRERALSMEAHVCRYDLATGEVHILTREPVRVHAPVSASPDGTKVAFVLDDRSIRRGSKEDVCVLDGLSGEVRNITKSLMDSVALERRKSAGDIVNAHARHVAWSLDGKFIAFESFVFTDVPGGDRGHWRVHVMEPDGSHPRELIDVENLIAEQLPEGFANAKDLQTTVQGLEWYGSGSRVLRLRVRFQKGSGVGEYTSQEVSYLAELDAKDLSLRTLQLIPEPKEPGGMPWSMVRSRQWSPDGRRLAYTVRTEKASPMAVDALYLVGADGVSNNAMVYKGGPRTTIDNFAWSPSGRYLALELWGAHGYAGLYAVSAEGGEPVAISRGRWRTIDVMPTWAACPPLADRR